MGVGMNISSVQAFKFNNYQHNNSNNVSSNSLQGIKYKNSLMADTVSFKAIPANSAKISDFVEVQIQNLTPRLKRIATTYLDILESVSFKLKDDNFSFDRVYCEKSPVKSPKSYASKVARSGTFKVPDTIRATVFCSNPYDLDSLNKLLDEMKKRGYVLAKTEIPVSSLLKKGYTPSPEELKKVNPEKLIPDLDIRLEDMAEQVTKLPAELKFSIGKPQKSGYEDIQMRFVRDFDKKKNPVHHELIVLFGPNYAQAKHNESKYVYSFLRQFDELSADLSDKTLGSHSQKASRYIDLIKQMFRGKVSQKLFLNAKNKDLYQLEDEIPISFSKEDIKIFEGYFSGLNDRISSVYSLAKKAPNIPADLKKELTKENRADKALLKAIHDGLKDTINHYNSLAKSSSK